VDVIFILLVFLAPLIGFVAGFLVGALRRASVRIAAALVVIVSPLAFLSMPLLLPAASPDERYGAAWALTMFGAHIALWSLFATLGVWVGTARGSRAE
jgi:hypothetical protein